MKRIDVDVIRVADKARLQLPFVDAAEHQDAIDALRIVGLRIELIERRAAHLELGVGGRGIDEKRQILVTLDLGIGDVGMRREPGQMQAVLEIGNDGVAHIRRHGGFGSGDQIVRHVAANVAADRGARREVDKADEPRRRGASRHARRR